MCKTRRKAPNYGFVRHEHSRTFCGLEARIAYGAGSTTVLPSRLTAVCASSRPLIDAPVCSVTAVWVKMTL